MSHEVRTNTSRYRWQIHPPAPPEHFKQFSRLDPLIVQLLYNRQVQTPDEVESFLGITAIEDNPFRLQGMNEAVTRIRQAIAQGERMAVYGDFDVDGVTSTALLVQVLQALGGKVEPYIPHRDDGYGLNKEALNELAERGIQLVITVDCGIRAVQEVIYGRQLGLDMIITDHHTPPSELPPALAIINPKQTTCRYAFESLPGVGLAFKLAQALMRVENRVPLGRRALELGEENLLDLVALGIVADLAPLRGENRRLTQRGLALLNQTRRVGLRALMEVAGVRPGQVTAETIGYVLGPRLNAAGRLDHAMVAYRLLTTQDPAEAQRLAAELNQRNAERQRLTEEAVQKALVQLAEETDPFFLIVGDADFEPGVVGLVASRLTELFYRPSLVLELGPDLSRGSARSIPEFNIIRALDQVGELLKKHGGHAAAAGLTVETGNIPELRRRLYQIATEQLAGQPLIPVLEIDAEWPLGHLKPETFHSLTLLEPFGVENPQPLFLARQVNLREASAVGAEASHLRLKLEQNRIVWDAIAFRQGFWADQLPQQIDIVYTPKIDIWNGRERLQLEIKDLRPSSTHQP